MRKETMRRTIVRLAVAETGYQSTRDILQDLKAEELEVLDALPPDIIQMEWEENAPLSAKVGELTAQYYRLRELSERKGNEIERLRADVAMRDGDLDEERAKVRGLTSELNAAKRQLDRTATAEICPSSGLPWADEWKARYEAALVDLKERDVDLARKQGEFERAERQAAEYRKTIRELRLTPKARGFDGTEGPDRDPNVVDAGGESYGGTT